MIEKKTLVLEFVTEDSETYSIIVHPPKDDLSKETVSEVMNTIVETDVFLTRAGRHLTDIKNAYYKTITIDELEFESPGE